MKRNYFNFTKINDRYLVTNDFGKYQFLNENEFRALVTGSVEEQSELGVKLEENGFVYSDTDLEFSKKWNYLVLHQKGYLTRASTLHIFVVTTCCNLSCVYCQANNGFRCSNLMMTEETAKKAVDIALQSPEEELNFEFQGGEPLINFPVIKYIVEYSEKNAGFHQIRYSLVSNLILLTDEIIAFIKEHNISVSTSIDGSELVHNKNRHFQNGEGSFKKTVEGVVRLRKAGISVGAIETTTKDSLPYAEEIVDAYKALGFHSIFLRPLTPLGRAYKIWDQVGYTTDEFLEFYKRALDEIVRLNKSGYSICETQQSIFLNRILGRYINYMELRSPCGGGFGQIAYYADGKIFTCDEGRMLYEMGDEAFCIGNVEDNSFKEILNTPVCRTVCASSTIESIPGCSDCVYQPYCGTCPVVNYALYGDVIEKSPRGYKCRLYKGIFDIIFNEFEKNEAEIGQMLENWGYEG